MKKIQLIIIAILVVYTYSNGYAQNESGALLKGSNLIVPFSASKSDTAKPNILDKKELMKVEKLLCSDNSYEISYYTLVVEIDSIITESRNQGNLFSPNCKKLINQMKSGARAWLEDISANQSKGIEKVLPSVRFIVR